MIQRKRWISLKYPPDPGIVLNPIKDNGKEAVFQTNRTIRYRRLVDNGETRWFSDSDRLAARRRNELNGYAPKALAKPKVNPQWHPLKRKPSAEHSLQLVKVEGQVFLFQNQRGVFYRCEIQDGVERWFSNAAPPKVKQPEGRSFLK